MEVSTYAPSLFDPESQCRTISDAYGKEYLRRIQRIVGGLEFRVPRKQSTLTPDCPLVKVLGHEDAAKIQEVLSGEWLYLPRGYRDVPIYDIVRRGVIAGQSNAEIARSAGVTARWVRKVKQNLRELSAFPQTAVPAE